eukprot:symbB.v1.2.040811.t1/scaffold7555.1/size10629/2
MERLQLTAAEGAVCAVAQTTREALQWQLWSFTGQNLANVAWAVAKLLNGRDAQCLLKAETPTRQDFFAPFLVALEERAWDLNAQELNYGVMGGANLGPGRSGATRGFGLPQCPAAGDVGLGLCQVGMSI